MRRIICIGGGELKTKTTLEIDRYIANLSKEKAGEKRAYGLFIGTASHDSMPYFNSFRKTYTSVFDIKADCALTVYNEMSIDKIKEKFLKADFIYVGGGDTIFMLEHWKNSGILDLVLDAYNRGVIICGLSAGAIFWFKTMYTDSKSSNSDETYSLCPGLGILQGCCSPHYNHRVDDFSKAIADSNEKYSIVIEDDCAVEFVDEKLVGKISSGGNAYIIENDNGVLTKSEIKSI